MRPWERSVIEFRLCSEPARSTMMPIMVQLGIMLAQRKVKSKGLAEQVGIYRSQHVPAQTGQGQRRAL